MGVWKSWVDHPYGLPWNYLRQDVFDCFAQRFDLAETYRNKAFEFEDLQKFMAGEKTRSTNGRYNDLKRRILPKDTYKYTTAYRDADGHVLVVAFGSSVKENVVEESVRDKGFVAVVFDKSHNFYRNDPLYVITNAETYEYFSSKGCYDDWAIKVLR